MAGSPLTEKLKTKSGELRIVDWRMTLVRDDLCAAPSVLMAGVDITEQEMRTRHIRFLATHDPLTGLRNRNSLLDFFPEAIGRTHRHGTLLVALFVDLDDFKSINDRYGHTAGDKVLAEAARRLLGCVRETDTVARFGGDEFLVLLEDVTDVSAGAHVAGKILDALLAPIDVGDVAVMVGASIGIAALPTDAGTADELMAAADAAMYLAKPSTPSGYRTADDFNWRAPLSPPSDEPPRRRVGAGLSTARPHHSRGCFPFCQ